jgi:hypothetical protein
MFLQFKCPNTKKGIRIEEKDEANNLRSKWNKFTKISCPHCPDSHIFAFRHAYIEGSKRLKTNKSKAPLT